MRQGYAWHTHRVSLLDGESQLRLGPEHVGDATTGMWPSTCVYCLRTARLGQQLRTIVCHHCLSQRGSLAGVLTFLAVAHHEQSESTRDRQGDAGTLEPHVYTANRATRNSFLRHSLLGDLHVARCGSRAELPPKPLFPYLDSRFKASQLTARSPKILGGPNLRWHVWMYIFFEI